MHRMTGPSRLPSEVLALARVGHVSWLEAGCSPSQGSTPSGTLEQPFRDFFRTSHSGGAAPDSHRLPLRPTRLCSVVAPT